MKNILLLPITFLLLTLSSCSEIIEEVIPQNDNVTLYGSEWSTQDETEWLKFYMDDSVMFFYSGGCGAGRFNFNKQSGYLALYYLTAIITGGKTAEFTSATIQSDGTMKLNWHIIGESDNYYMVLYKRR